MQIGRVTSRRFTLTFVLLGLSAAAPVTAALAADAPESPAQETAVELREASIEEAEEAQAAALDAAIAAQHPAYARRIERLRRLIHDTRAGLLAVRKLPHSTTRWQEHRPRKRERLKRYRLRIRALRASYAEAPASAPATPRG